MIYVCDGCEKKLKNTFTLYRGFDCTFCSKSCFDKIAKINIKNDPTFTKHHLWYKCKSPKKIIETTLKRTTSILEFELELQKKLKKLNI